MFTQENRLLTIDTPLGADQLLLTGLKAREGVSLLYNLQLELLSENHSIMFEDIIGQNVLITIVLANGETRFFHGMVASFAQGQGVEPGGPVGGGLRLASYTATVVPWTWLLTRTTDSRIFQEMSVPDIVEQIFSEKGLLDYELRLHGTYDPRTYCVQYRETDFNFINRILEEEGIYYFFQHEEDKHTMIIVDAPDEIPFCLNQEEARCDTNVGSLLDEDIITSLQMERKITVGKYTVNDFNFEIPNTDLKTEVESSIALGPGEREWYDHPAEFNNRGRGDAIANLRLQADEASITTIRGMSNCRAFTSGYKFLLLDYFREEMNSQEYMLLSVDHVVTQPMGIGTGGGTYSNSFTCMPINIPYRPMLSTPKPMVAGSQTAIVVGPPGEEIYSDEHGRVKVQFHWDREGQRDENSSCWVRVSQAWAGAGWGTMFVPRIGHEVIVDFLEGDPDRPIITGRVYHGMNTPPYGLPDEQTKSTIKSNSSPGGGGYNELRFEDKKGKEQVYVQAQRNMDTLVKANETRKVGGNRTTHVKGNFKETIDGTEERLVQGTVNETINGDETRMLNANLTESISGNEARTVNGDLSETIMGSLSETTLGSQSTMVTGSLNEQIIGGIKTMTPATFDLTALGGVNITSPGGITMTALGGINLVAPGGNTTVDSWFTSIGGKDEDMFALQSAIVSMENKLCGISTAATATKIETAGFVLQKTFAQNEDNPMKLRDGAVKLGKGAYELLDNSLTMIGL